jgi:hypothetical protein
MHDPGLVAAIYSQVNPDDVSKSLSRIYVARVIYQRTEYHIHGKVEQWKSFFRYPGTTQIKTPRGMNTN